MFHIYASDLTTLWVLLGVIGFFGLLVLIIILVKKKTGLFQIKKDETISEEDAIKEELDRVLVPIEDEKTLEQMKEDNVDKEETSK